MDESKRYTYSFSVYPGETWGFDRAVFDLFHAMNYRVQMEFTERNFELFRSALSRHGLTLREIERWPYHFPEVVS